MQQPVEVLCDSSAPRAFFWRGQLHSVIEWGRHWTDCDGTHWLVRTTHGHLYELIWVAAEASWCLRTPGRPMRLAG